MTSTGTYSYDSNMHILTTNFTHSDFPAGDGPPPGITPWSVLTLSSTTMRLKYGDNDLTWNRDGGGTGEPVGTWYRYDDEAIVEVTFGADNTVSTSVNDVNENATFFLVRNKTVVVDCDFGDWDDRDIVYVDIDGPDCNDAPGQDIQKVYVAHDDDYVYVRFVLNAPLDGDTRYLFGDNFHINLRKMQGSWNIEYWDGDLGRSGSFPPSNLCVNSNQFEFRVDKNDVRSWKDKELNAWLGEHNETCMDYVDLPLIDLGL